MNQYFKIPVLFIIIGIIYGQNTNIADSTYRINLHEKKIALRDVLEIITQQYGVYFIYDDNIVDDINVSCNFSNEQLYNCIKILVDPFEINIKKVTPITYVLYINDQRTIYGFVFDAEQNMPLVKANVYIENTNIGMETGTDGKFRLVIPVETEILTISYIGYETKKIFLLESSDGLNIPLNPMVIKLDPIVTSSSAITGLDEQIKNQFYQNDQTSYLTSLVSMKSNPVARLPAIQRVTEVRVDPETQGKIFFEYNAVEFSESMSAWQLNIRNRIRKEQFRDDLTIVEGIRFYEPYHLNSIPKLNSNVYSQEMLNHAEYVCGGFDAGYGDALNTMLSIKYKNNENKPISGRISAGIAGQNFYVSSGDPSKYSFMLHAKRYDNRYLPEPRQTEGDILSDAFDIQAKLQYHFNPNHNLSFFWLISNDNHKYSYDFNVEKQPGVQEINDQSIYCVNNIYESRRNHVKYSTDIISAYSDHTVDNWQFRARLSFYNNNWQDVSNLHYAVISTFPIDLRYISNYYIDQNVSRILKERVLEGECNLKKDISENRQSRFGMSIKRIEYFKDMIWQNPYVLETNVPQENDTASFNYQHPLNTYTSSDGDSTVYQINAYKINFYYLEKLHFMNKVFFNAGFRLDLFTLNKTYSINPRFRLHYPISSNILFQLAWGIYSQTPSIHQIEWLNYKNKIVKNQKAYHYIGSLEAKIMKESFIKLEVFYKNLKRLIPVNRLGDGSLVYMSTETNRRGYTKGIETSIRSRYHPFRLECSYTLQDTKERVSGDIHYFPRYNDQRYTFSFEASMIFWKNAQTKLCYYYGSGYAFTLYSFSEETNQWEIMNYNTDYFPAYQRIDLEIEKSFQLAYGSIGVSLKMINLLNRKNVFAYNYSSDAEGIPIKKPQVLYGFIPLLEIYYTF